MLAGLVLWEVVGRFVVKNPLFLATPSQTALALVKLWRDGALQHHSWVSAQEFVLGFALAVLAGIPVGLVTASWRRPAAIRRWRRRRLPQPESQTGRGPSV